MPDARVEYSVGTGEAADTAAEEPWRASASGRTMKPGPCSEVRRGERPSIAVLSRA